MRKNTIFYDYAYKKSYDEEYERQKQASMRRKVNEDVQRRIRREEFAEQPLAVRAQQKGERFNNEVNKVTRTALTPRDRKRVRVRGSIFSDLY